MVLHVLPLLDYQPFSRSAEKIKGPGMRSNFSLDGYVLNKRFLFTRKIGAGTFGLIYLVRDLESSANYAAKITLTSNQSFGAHGADKKTLLTEKIHAYFACHHPLQARELDLKTVQKEGKNIASVREIALHLTVHDHPNIATIHHVLLLGNFAVVTMMDYFLQGDLFGNIIDRRVFECPPAHQNKQLLMKNCMLQLIDSVAYCASRSVFHCDLKPENVMIAYNPQYKRPEGDTNVVDYREIQIFLIDFGLAMTSPVICCNVCRGSSFYMAPERIVNYNTCGLVKSLVNMDEYPTNAASDLELASKLFPTLAGDIWSLGVLFVNITCSKNPWPVANINDRHEVFHNYILNDSAVLKKILPILRQFNRLLNDVFQLNPNRRVDLQQLAETVVACDFFQDLPETNPQLLTPPAEFSPMPTLPGSSYFEKGVSSNTSSGMGQQDTP